MSRYALPSIRVRILKSHRKSPSGAAPFRIHGCSRGHSSVFCFYSKDAPNRRNVSAAHTFTARGHGKRTRCPDALASQGIAHAATIPACSHDSHAAEGDAARASSGIRRTMPGRSGIVDGLQSPADLSNGEPGRSAVSSMTKPVFCRKPRARVGSQPLAPHHFQVARQAFRFFVRTTLAIPAAKPAGRMSSASRRVFLRIPYCSSDPGHPNDKKLPCGLMRSSLVPGLVFIW